MNIKLTILMESRIHGDVYVRFGGEHSETYCRERQQGAGCLAYQLAMPEDYGFQGFIR
jgi:hypothetical protein